MLNSKRAPDLASGAHFTTSIHRPLCEARTYVRIIFRDRSSRTDSKYAGQNIADIHSSGAEAIDRRSMSLVFTSRCMSPPPVCTEVTISSTAVAIGS